MTGYAPNLLWLHKYVLALKPGACFKAVTKAGHLMGAIFVVPVIIKAFHFTTVFSLGRYCFFLAQTLVHLLVKVLHEAVILKRGNLS